MIEAKKEVKLNEALNQLEKAANRVVKLEFRIERVAANKVGGLDKKKENAQKEANKANLLKAQRKFERAEKEMEIWQVEGFPNYDCIKHWGVEFSYVSWSHDQQTNPSSIRVLMDLMQEDYLIEYARFRHNIVIE